MKTGRNEPCPCGSGKKYKKCCGAAGTPSAATSAPGRNVEPLMGHAWQLFQAGRLTEAERAYQQVLEQQPDNPDALHLLGGVASKLGQLQRARELIGRAASLQPERPDLRNNLGYLLNDLREPDGALEVLTRAIELKPDYPDAYLNRAIALKALGRIDAAIADCRRALALAPDLLLAQTNLLYFLNSTDALGEAEIFREHSAFGTRYRRQVQPMPPAPARDPGRPLRIGYVSPDLRTHSVGYFIEPVLREHDHDRFRIFGYYNFPRADATTDRLRGYCDEWRVTIGLNDRQFAQQVRRDDIDILVDLAGYTSGSRILACALRPARVQVTWLGYPNTTGLPGIDYRISDAIADPPGVADRLHTERLLRLPDCFLCYQPPDVTPAPAPPPFIDRGFITFGSFNNLGKITDAVLATWADILHAVPDSRLVLKNSGLNGAQRRQQLRLQFENLGIAGERVLLSGSEPTLQAHLQRYSEIDIALDTFPYNGTTTTCEALWMGAPVVTFGGDGHRSRVSTSLLHTLRMDELSGRTPDEYRAIAVALAGDRNRLAALRPQLRRRMTDSPLTDARTFTRQLESALTGIMGCLPLTDQEPEH